MNKMRDNKLLVDQHVKIAKELYAKGYSVVNMNIYYNEEKKRNEGKMMMSFLSKI